VCGRRAWAERVANPTLTSKQYDSYEQETQQMRFSFKKKLVVGAAAAAVIAGTSIGAFAYFTSSGTGSGSATVGSATAWTVGETGTPTGGPLYPDASIGGSNVQTDSYTVTNGGSGSQNLTNVVIKVAKGDGSPWSSQADGSKPACTASDFSVGGQAVGSAWTDTALAGDFTAGQSKSTGSVTVEMIDNGANQDNCQGVIVPLYFFAS
jgi:hypothetical protein